MKHIQFLLLMPLVASLSAATYYVDNSLSTGANNGTSWADAWQTLSFSGLAAGDTVYISGGATGGTQTYNLTGEFTSIAGFTTGSAGSLVTYKIGQDASHNGTAIFHRTATGSQFLFGGSYYIISGDAGDGNRHFKTTNYASLLTLNNSTKVRISFIDCGDLGSIGSINPGTNIEIDHLYFYSTDLAADHGLYANFSTVGGPAYDENLIHDNVVNLPYSNSYNGFGADGFQLAGTAGWSLYNNTVNGFPVVYTGSQHQDGWQGPGGNYIKIYNNRFTDIQNYALFGELPVNNTSYIHVRVFNNICVQTRSNSTQAIAFGAVSSLSKIDTDVVIANNIADGYALPFTFRNPFGSDPAAFVNCYFYNNVDVNTTGGGNIIDSGVTSATNVSVSSGNAPSYFTSWTSYGASNAYTLLAGATPLIHTGTSASSFGITTDFAGNAYANPPSIGAYEYVSSGPSGPIYKRLGRYLKFSGLAASLLISFCLLFSGCALVSQYKDAALLKAGYQKKAVAESIIEQTKKEYDAKLTDNQKQQDKANQDVIKGWFDKAQFASDHLYGADFTFQTLLHPDRAHIIMDNKVNEARAVLPLPTIEAMAAQNAEVKRQLDETLTSLDQLKADHEKDIANAKVVTDRATKAEQELADAQKAKTDLEAAKAKALQEKQDALNKINDDVIASEHARSDDAKARQATLEKLSWAAGILAALCFAGAIWSPISKVQLGMFGGVMSIAAVGIWYITPLIVLITVLILVAGVVGWMVYNHNISNKTNTALVNAVQDIKEKAPEIYTATVKPALEAWTTKYIKAPDGTITTVPDPSVTTNIDNHLITSNRV